VPWATHPRGVRLDIVECVGASMRWPTYLGDASGRSRHFSVRRLPCDFSRSPSRMRTYVSQAVLACARGRRLAPTAGDRPRRARVFLDRPPLRATMALSIGRASPGRGPLWGVGRRSTALHGVARRCTALHGTQHGRCTGRSTGVARALHGRCTGVARALHGRGRAWTGVDGRGRAWTGVDGRGRGAPARDGGAPSGAPIAAEGAALTRRRQPSACSTASRVRRTASMCGSAARPLGRRTARLLAINAGRSSVTTRMSTKGTGTDAARTSA